MVLAYSSVPAEAQAPAPAGPTCAVNMTRIGGLAVTQIFGLATPPVGSSSLSNPFQGCIWLAIDNPTPGDILPQGGYAMQGFAFDPSLGVGSGAGAGIQRIQVFLDDPSGGGQIVGEADIASAGSAQNGSAQNQLGVASDRAASFGAQFATAGFRLVIQIPRGAMGQEHSLFFTAQSTSGRTATVAVPVGVGQSLGIGVGSPAGVTAR